MQIISKCFSIDVAEDSSALVYRFGDKTCILPVNDSDIRHGNNLGLTGLEHKLLHEITHYYVARAFGYACCPVVYAQAFGLPMPENATFLEEIVFSTEYLTFKKEMLFDNWFSYLDRLHGKVNIWELQNTILQVLNASKLNITCHV